MNDYDALVHQLGHLQDRIAGLEQVHERSHRMGTVEQIDPIKKRARFRIGGSDDKIMLSPWIPFSQTAGGLYQEHIMPQVGQPSDPFPASTKEITKSGKDKDTKKGQQFSLHSNDGNFENGYALPLTFSNDNPAPSNDPNKIARQHVDNQKKPKKRSVKWDSAGDSQVQVNKAKHHITETNHHVRVNDSRDGTDSLQQELKPQKKKKEDKVHYSDTDGKQGLTRSVDNDKHKVTVHPTKGIQHSVNLPEKPEKSEPGPAEKTTDKTHTHLIDLAKGIIASVSSNQHGSHLDPSGIIKQLVNLTKTDKPGQLGEEGGSTHKAVLDVAAGILHSAFGGAHTTTHDSKGISHKTSASHSTEASQSISDKAGKISHDGETSVSKNLAVGQNLNVTSLLSAAAGKFGSASFHIDEIGHFLATTGGEVTQGFTADKLQVTKGAAIAQGLTTDTLKVLAGASIVLGLLADFLKLSAGADIKGGLTTDTVAVSAGGNIQKGLAVSGGLRNLGGLTTDALIVTLGLDLLGGLIVDKLFGNFKNFASDAAARAGGLLPGQVYQTAGTLKVVTGGALPIMPGRVALAGHDAALAYQSGIAQPTGAPGSFGVNGHDATFKRVLGPETGETGAFGITGSDAEFNVEIFG